MRRVREDFPISNEVVYMNTAAISLKPVQVIDAMTEFMKGYEANGTVNFSDSLEGEVLENARCRISELIGCRSDDIALTTNTSEGINFVAHSIKFEHGNNVVTTDLEFPTVTYPWLKIAKEKGVEVRFALNRNGIVSVEDLEKLVDDNTRVIALSHVEYSSGQRFNLREVADLAHRHGAILVVDAVQSLGVIPLNVKRENVDALASAAYKWLLGPFGAGFVYMRKELYENVMPPFVGWRSNKEHEEYDPQKFTLPETARRFEYGGMPYTPIYGLTKAIEYIMSIGIENIREHVMNLTQKLIDGLNDLGAQILTPSNREQRAGIVSARFDKMDYDKIVEELAKNKIIVSKRMNALRISPHIYNVEEDVMKFVEAIKKVRK
ncbi:MAG: aminotransferase class V-fold PLP-dependent enzyme [Nitrososphaeria archaeon]|nr:aminotransferase class V-fold PLP-dependent enzyme [Nitrososphaeria archaeon]